LSQKKGLKMSKATKNSEVKAAVVRSVSMSAGYELAQALSSKGFNPSVVDDFYKHQRKISLKYAKELVAV
jgi:hypothetical protein